MFSVLPILITPTGIAGIPSLSFETDRAGYEANKLHGKLGIRANDTAEVSFNNVRIPASNLIGRLGDGFKELMGFFNLTRLHICAMAVGIARLHLKRV